MDRSMMAQISSLDIVPLKESGIKTTFFIVSTSLLVGRWPLMDISYTMERQKIQLNYSTLPEVFDEEDIDGKELEATDEHQERTDPENWLAEESKITSWTNEA